MYKHVKTELVPLTPQFASEFSALPTFSGDRSRDTRAGVKRIQWLASLVDEGSFHNPKWATANLRGVTYRVNGGHSSLMLSQCNGSFPDGLHAVVDRYECHDEADFADLFDIFDSSKSSRTKKDRVKAHAAVEGDLADVSTTNVSRIIAGIGVYLTSCGDNGGIGVDEQLGLVHHYQDTIKFIDQFLSPKHLRSSAIVGAMVATYDSNPDKAGEFWRLVADESHPSRDNPTRTLARFIRDNHGNTRSRVPSRGVYSKCIHAANAWWRGSATNLHYASNAPVPSLKWTGKAAAQ